MVSRVVLINRNCPLASGNAIKGSNGRVSSFRHLACRKAKIVAHLTQRNGLRPGSGVFRFARSVEVVFCRLCGISVWRGPHRARIVTAAGPARLLEKMESLEFWFSIDK